MKSSSLLLTSDLSLKGNHNLETFDAVNIRQSQQDKQNLLIEQVEENLSACGQIVKRHWYCKHCERENLDTALLRVDKTTRLDCQIRYCSNPQCINTRFARINDVLSSVPRLKGLRGMFHFTIGFNKINITNFKEQINSQRRNINSYFAKLKKLGVHFNGFQVLDISKGKKDGSSWDGKYYVHYHVISIPWKSHEVRRNMILMKQVEKGMKLKQRNKNPFFVKVHGIKNKDALFSYLSIRAVGLYKPYDSKETNYSKLSKKLVDSVQSGRFMTLNQIISIEQYVSMFYKRRMFSIIGKEIHILKGSIILDNVLCKYPTFCKIHGNLTRQDVRLENVLVFSCLEPPPPPNFIKSEVLQVKTINPYTWGIK